MTQFIENVKLKYLNTFEVGGIASKYAEFVSQEDLTDIFGTLSEDLPWMVIGQGSNILFRNNFEGLLLKSVNNNIEILYDDDNYFEVKVGAGVVWDDFVNYTIIKGGWGAENLSYIPGSVGASPVQNVGAYGQQASDIIKSVEIYLPNDGRVINISNASCEFGYRSSIFKTKLAGKAVVLSVIFKLLKNGEPQLSYGNLKEELTDDKADLSTIRSAIIKIRKEKLPEVGVIGSGGSFFKNPIVDIATFEKLKSEYNDMPFYNVDNGIKLAAGWLIEKAGWKGYRSADAGVYDKQALILVNYGNASGEEIYQLSHKIASDIMDKFSVTIEPEIIVI